MPRVKHDYWLCVACQRLLPHAARGRCKLCYWTGLRCVKAGFTTWEYLESVGLAIPVQPLKNKDKDDGE